MAQKIGVRKLEIDDIPFIVQYWLHSPSDYLVNMGVDLNKLPKKFDLIKTLTNQLNLPVNKKQSYAFIWTLDKHPIGHCNVNKISFGEKAHMHLHIWDAKHRKKGFGYDFLKATVPLFFKDLQLKSLYCEPKASNEAPNKSIEKVGFKLLKRYSTIPGSLNFKQEVNQWVLAESDFKTIYTN